MATSNYYIVYISPNNSPRKVAEVFAGQLRPGAGEVHLLDLSGQSGYDGFIEKLAADPQACLLIGSPVYRDMAVPPVMAFINALAPSNTGWAVPFVTWGKACSGVALWQMGSALREKGYQIAGAARVAALHAMMWQADQPVGEGHPDENDKQQVRELADRLLARGDAGTFTALPLAALDYQPAELAAEFKAKIEKPWMVIPKTVDEETCTQCGICEDECPVAAVSLDPYPLFGENCFDCFNCIRLCPEEAIEPGVPMAKIEEMIRGRVTTVNEQPLTEIY